MSFLYLKDEPVLKLKDVNGEPSELISIINPELVPLCFRDECTTENFVHWLGKRRMPENREGLDSVIERFGTDWQKKNINYLSLSDQYWIKRREERWKQVNFFTNKYKPDVGQMFFSPWKINSSRFETSPDLMCGGVLKKCWKQKDDRTSYLVKASSTITHQDPLSEVLVSVFCEKLNKIKCLKYELHVEGTCMCSKCDNFVTPDIDFVPASYIYMHEKRTESETILEHLLRMCELFDIPNAEEHLKWMVFVDFVTGNSDRNLNNLGFLRDINTLKFIGPAPLFDSGNAYWNSTTHNEKGVRCFAESEKKIFSDLKKSVDLSFLKEDYHEDLISKYPEIMDEQKEKLIGAIKNKNNLILNRDSVDIER